MPPIRDSRKSGDVDDDGAAPMLPVRKMAPPSPSGPGSMASTTSSVGPKQDVDITKTPSLPRHQSKPAVVDENKPSPTSVVADDEDAKVQARASAQAGREAAMRDAEELRQAKMAAMGGTPATAAASTSVTSTANVASMPPVEADMDEDMINEKIAAVERRNAEDDMKPGAVAVTPTPSREQVSSDRHPSSKSLDMSEDGKPEASPGYHGAAPIAATLVDDEDMEAQVEKRVRQETDDIASEVQRRIFDQAVVADVMEPDAKQPPQESSFNWKKWGVIGVILLIVVAVAVVLGVILSKDSQDKTPVPTVPPTPAPTLPPTSAPTVPPTPAPTGELRGQLEQEFGPILPGTPQADALQWLTDVDELVTPDTPFRIVKERYVMAVLYYSTDGENWSETFGFLDGNSTCSWNDGTSFPTINSGDGIFCYNSNSVTHIKLESNDLQGNFPAELTALQSLEILDLRDNNIQGTIPTTVGTLSSLEVFNLAENFIVGTLPETLFDLPQLETLYLFDNRELTGTLPNTLGTTGGRRLVSLGLSSCRLSGTIPTSMTDLSSLQFVNLLGNSFQGSIPAFTSPSITDIFLSENELEGEIPGTIGELRNLRRLGVSQNSLRGPIPLFTGSTSLIDIWLHENSFTGNLQQFLVPLQASRSLERLWVNSNQLTGSIPVSIGNFTTLTSLNLEINDFGGPLPSEFGRLTSLRELDLYGANVDGSIPSELGLMTALTFLDLAVNNWGGTTVPTEIGNLRVLTLLSVAFNRHVGIFPSEIGSIQTLERLLVQGNGFSGNLEAVCSARSVNPIDDFYADCAGPVIETECSCCSHCCASDGSNCEEVFG